MTAYALENNEKVIEARNINVQVALNPPEAVLAATAGLVVSFDVIAIQGGRLRRLAEAF